MPAQPQPHFTYGETEIAWLKSRDPALGAVIDELGPIRREVTPDLFTALISSIVGQQISSKALETVWGRVAARFDPLTPQALAAAPLEEVQACGISWRKAEYIKGIAEAVLSGELDLAALRHLPDAEVCARLAALRGIGVWTAEMLLIFCLQRPNILSRDDLAILRGLRMLYRHRRITPALFAKYKRRYAPYASVASLYLWAIAGGACPHLTDCAPKKPAARQRGGSAPGGGNPKGHLTL